MSYAPPVEEQKFLLNHIVRLDELTGGNAFAEASEDETPRQRTIAG